MAHSRSGASIDQRLSPAQRCSGHDRRPVGAAVPAIRIVSRADPEQRRETAFLTVSSIATSINNY
jgi:hypothetical protein